MLIAVNLTGAESTGTPLRGEMDVAVEHGERVLGGGAKLLASTSNTQKVLPRDYQQPRAGKEGKPRPAALAATWAVVDCRLPILRGRNEAWSPTG